MGLRYISLCACTICLHIGIFGRLYINVCVVVCTICACAYIFVISTHGMFKCI